MKFHIVPCLFVCKKQTMQKDEKKKEKKTSCSMEVFWPNVSDIYFPLSLKLSNPLHDADLEFVFDW